MNIVLTLIAVTATVVGSGMALPQARHLARTRRVDGVSPAWVGVSVALNGWWIAYAFGEQVWAVVPVSVVSVVLYGAIGVFLFHTVGRRCVPGLLVGGLLLGMVPLPFLLAGGWTLAGVTVGLCYGLQLLPAVVAACRSRELAGISAATWIIACAEAALWFGYGLGIADIAVMSAGVLGVVMSGVILVRLAVTGHRPMQTLVRRRRIPLFAPGS